MSVPDLQIVGRERELTVAFSVFEDSREDARALVLEGEAGIGKTALLRAIVERAAAGGDRVLSCQAEQAETQLAFAGLSELVEPSLDTAVAALPAPQREALEIALLRRASGELTPDRRTLGVALHSLLCNLARETPLVVAIDDLQWLDTSTLRLLAFAIRRLEVHRVAIVLTQRVPPFSADPLGLERAFEGERLTRLRLPGLEDGEIGSLLELHLGRPYSRRVTAKVAQASGGNPLFALECARALGSSTSVAPAGRLPVPDSLRELVRVRLSAVAPDVRESLLAAAALAQPTASVVERASSSDGLAGAEESGLVRVLDGRLQFAHPLYAAAVYDTTALEDRREIHSRLAELLEDRDERAQHLAFASSEPDEQIARELEGAAANARSRGASATAAALLELAINLTPENRLEASLRRMTQAAEDHLFAGEGKRPRALLEAVAAGLPTGVERARVLCSLGQVMFWHESYAEAVELLQQALQESAGEEWVRARVLLDMGWVQSQRGELNDLSAHLAEALEIAERLEDQQLLAEALAAVSVVQRRLGEPFAEEMLERALELERWDTRTYMGMRPSFTAGWLYMWTGRLERARACFEVLEEQLIANGQESTLGLGTLLPVMIDCAAGHAARAVKFCDQSLLAARDSDSRIIHGTILGARAIALAHLGEVEAAEGDVRESLAQFGGGDVSASHLVLIATRGFIALSAGDAPLAEQTLDPLASLVLAHGVGEPMLAAFLADDIEALVVLGELERAEALTDLLERQGQKLDSGWALAVAGRCRGLLCLARGELQTATSTLEQALICHERLGMPVELARTLLVHGRVQRRRRQKRAASESLGRALALFEECSATLWAKQAQAEIARLGTRTAPTALTERERQVASLAAGGMTNKDIAAELFISPKTVEANIARAYRKLGVRSRAELGGAMAMRGLAGAVEPQQT
jgi:DNA-binding CsgD family transcriptional regulator